MSMAEESDCFESVFAWPDHHNSSMAYLPGGMTTEMEAKVVVGKLAFVQGSSLRVATIVLSPYPLENCNLSIQKALAKPFTQSCNHSVPGVIGCQGNHFVSNTSSKLLS
jgi:hypothetical protein